MKYFLLTVVVFALFVAYTQNALRPLIFQQGMVGLHLRRSQLNQKSNPLTLNID
jgi:hypothetical protein